MSTPSSGTARTATPRSGPPSVLCFDLGGVLLDLGGVTDLARLGGRTPEAFLQRWLTDPWVRAFERGHIGTDEFAARFVAAWSLDVTPDRFLEVFARWPRGLFPGAEELLRALRGRVRLACLSNTNVLHWARQGPEWGLEELFDVRLLSFRTGHVKPDSAAYEHARAELGVAAGSILFLDDNLVNVNAARAAGWRAEHTAGLSAVRETLAGHGF